MTKGDNEKETPFAAMPREEEIKPPMWKRIYSTIPKKLLIAIATMLACYIAVTMYQYIRWARYAVRIDIWKRRLGRQMPSCIIRNETDSELRKMWRRR